VERHWQRKDCWYDFDENQIYSLTIRYCHLLIVIVGKQIKIVVVLVVVVVSMLDVV
jgi:hypothetical protein